MSQIREAENVKFPWVLVIVVSLFVSFLGVFWHLVSFSGLGFYNSLSTMNAISAVTVAEWLLLFLAWPLARIGFLKKRINTQTLAYLYIIGICAAFYTTILGDIFTHIVGNRVQQMTEQESWLFYDWFLAPPRPIVQQIVTGGLLFPAAEWIPVLAFWWILTLMPSLFLVGIVALFRRSWIDIEKVPFPLTMVSYELLKRIPHGEDRKLKLFSSPFLIGFIVGVIFQVPVSLIQLFPWFPDIFAIRGNCCGFVWYVKAGTSLAPIIGLGTANLQPLMAAVAYFIPLSISFNSWFWYLVYMILMQGAYMMGYYTNADTAGGCGRGWCVGYSGLMSPPFNFMSVSEAGGLVGLTIFSLWLSRRYLLDTLRAASGKMKGSAPLDIESKESLSYRSIWLLVALGFIGTIAVFMVAGVSAWPAFLMPITYFLYFYANTRLYGLSGGYMRGMSHGGSILRLLVWPTQPTTYTREFMLTSVFTKAELDICSGRLFGASNGAFASFRMADLAGLDNRNAFKAILVASVLIPVTTWFAFVWIVGNIGFPRVARAAPDWGNGFRWANTWDTEPNPGNWVPYFFAGIVIVGVLTLLHARFIWFPFEPIGFLNGTSFNSLISGFWLSFLVAWVAKTITLRIGGSNVYEKYGLPAASGLVTGCMLIYLVLGAVGIVRFYIPF